MNVTAQLDRQRTALTHPRLSVCIVNWNTCDFLYACLSSLRKGYHATRYETIVVDNASSDGSASMVNLLFPSVKKIINSENLGYARANNQALEQATGDFILFLNPDTIIPDRVFDVLIDKMDADPSIGVISCQLRNPDGSIQHFCSGLPNRRDEIFLQAGLDKQYPNHRWAGHRSMSFFSCDTEQDMEQPPGTFLLTRKSVIDRIGGFDEQFPIFFNDVDWCKRVIDAGWRIVFTPAVYIYHHKSASVKKQLAKSLTDAFYMRKRYYKKHFGFLTNMLLSAAAPIISRKNHADSLDRLLKRNSEGPFLVIKSSFDAHFDQCIQELMLRQPRARWHLLCTKDDDIKKYGKSFTHCYRYKGRSSIISRMYIDKKLFSTLLRIPYQGIFFPHATVDGAGYWNIVRFAASVGAPAIGAFGIDNRWHLFYPYGLKRLRGLFVVTTAYLLLLIGYAAQLVQRKQPQRSASTYGTGHIGCNDQS